MNGVCVAVSTLWQGKHMPKRTKLIGNDRAFRVTTWL